MATWIPITDDSVTIINGNGTTTEAVLLADSIDNTLPVKFRPLTIHHSEYRSRPIRDERWLLWKTQEIKEGADCPCCYAGKLEVHVESCLCHLGNPPCTGCTIANLKCRDCLEEYRWYELPDYGTLIAGGHVYIGIAGDNSPQFDTAVPINGGLRCRNCNRKTAFKSGESAMYCPNCNHYSQLPELDNIPHNGGAVNDERDLSPQEAAYAAKLKDKENDDRLSQQISDCFKKAAERRNGINALKVSDPHAAQFGLAQFQEAFNEST